MQPIIKRKGTATYGTKVGLGVACVWGQVVCDPRRRPALDRPRIGHASGKADTHCRHLIHGDGGEACFNDAVLIVIVGYVRNYIHEVRRRRRTQCLLFSAWLLTKKSTAHRRHMSILDLINSPILL